MLGNLWGLGFQSSFELQVYMKLTVLIHYVEGWVWEAGLDVTDQGSNLCHDALISEFYQIKIPLIVNSIPILGMC